MYVLFTFLLSLRREHFKELAVDIEKKTLVKKSKLYKKMWIIIHSLFVFPLSGCLGQELWVTWCTI